jgi:pimeloyl-ACP methyl ester carboxylesterase
METRLAGATAQWDRPEPLKFALPLILLPELFADATHLALARGYFASIGWEVYALDLRSAAEHSHKPAHGAGTGASAFEALASILSQALGALGRDAIVAGHGLGGLLALDAADNTHVRAAVALAPMLPGFKSRLVMNAANWPVRLFGGALKPPRGATLLDLLADADPFQRQALAGALAPERSRAALEIVRGRIDFPKHSDVPKLIVAGESDPFAPPDRMRDFAEKIGATIRIVPGRGHWLVGGRALERAVTEVQRFLVRNIGSDLLLFYSDEPSEPDDEDAG